MWGVLFVLWLVADWCIDWFDWLIDRLGVVLQGRLVSLLDDNTLHLWEVRQTETGSHLEESRSFVLPGRPGLNATRSALIGPLWYSMLGIQCNLFLSTLGIPHILFDCFLNFDFCFSVGQWDISYFNCFDYWGLFSENCLELTWQFNILNIYLINICLWEKALDRLRVINRSSAHGWPYVGEFINAL